MALSSLRSPPGSRPGEGERFPIQFGPKFKELEEADRAELEQPPTADRPDSGSTLLMWDILLYNVEPPAEQENREEERWGEGT